jgi:hypothetical protein
MAQKRAVLKSPGVCSSVDEVFVLPVDNAVSKGK